jgi:1-deoxy-D-xylulose-5-phosphate synthase
VAAAAGFRLVVTVEDNGLAGGFGDAVGRALRAAGTGADLLTVGLRQEYVQVGERDRLLAEHGLDAAGIATAVLDRIRVRRVPGRGPGTGSPRTASPSTLAQPKRRASAR